MHGEGGAEGMYHGKREEPEGCMSKEEEEKEERCFQKRAQRGSTKDKGSFLWLSCCLKFENKAS